MSDLITAQGQQVGPHVPIVIDVRGPEEYAAGHIAGARNIPADRVPERLPLLPGNRPLVTY